MLVKSRDRGISLLRAALLSVLLGHWLANALFDRDQYSGASPKLTAHLHDPFLIQALLVLLTVGALTVWERHRGRTGAGSLLGGVGRLRLLGILVTAQVCLFVGMEATERLAIGALSADPVHVGAFGTGFVAELLVAIGVALVLAVLGAATARIVEILRRRDPTPATGSTGGSHFTEFARPPRVLAGAGGVRAPPVGTSSSRP